MKNKNLKVGMLSVVLFIGSMGWLSFSVSANNTTLHNLSYEVNLEEDGFGQIIETRVMTIEEGTENFFEHEGLSEEDFLEFEVFADGEPLIWNDNWDSEDTREEKANEYGMLETANGVEFVWGIPEYGEITYELHYTIQDMVWQLEDGQSMNWRFFAGDGSLTPDQMSLTVHAPNDLTAENTTLALLGLEGAEWQLNNGFFESEKEFPLSSGEDIILLLQFHEEWFSDLETLDLTLEEQAGEALAGSSYYDETGDSGFSDRGTSNELAAPEYEEPLFSRLISGIVSLWPLLIILIGGIIAFGPKFLEKYKEKNGHMTQVDDLILVNEGKYTHEIPFDGEIARLAFLLDEIDAGLFEDYFFSFLLKWAKEEKIQMIPTQVGKIRKREALVIHVNGLMEMEAPKIEQEFWSMIEGAKDEENKILRGDLSSWARANYDKLNEMEENLIEDSKWWLENHGYITEEKHHFLGVFPITIHGLTQEGEALFHRILQFENFLKAMDDRKLSREEIDKVEDWDEFLVWTCLLGHGQEIVYELEKHFPEVWEDTLIHYPYYGYHHHMYGYRTQMRQGYNSGRFSSSSSGTFTSGGSGGSFGGGGGGSMGGGSSGVR